MLAFAPRRNVGARGTLLGWLPMRLATLRQALTALLSPRDGRVGGSGGWGEWPPEEAQADRLWDDPTFWMWLMH